MPEQFVANPHRGPPRQQARRPVSFLDIPGDQALPQDRGWESPHANRKKAGGSNKRKRSPREAEKAELSPQQKRFNRYAEMFDKADEIRQEQAEAETDEEEGIENVPLAQRVAYRRMQQEFEDTTQRTIEEEDEEAKRGEKEAGKKQRQRRARVNVAPRLNRRKVKAKPRPNAKANSRSKAKTQSKPKAQARSRARQPDDSDRDVDEDEAAADFKQHAKHAAAASINNVVDDQHDDSAESEYHGSDNSQSDSSDTSDDSDGQGPPAAGRQRRVAKPRPKDQAAGDNDADKAAQQDESGSESDDHTEFSAQEIENMQWTIGKTERNRDDDQPAYLYCHICNYRARRMGTWLSHYHDCHPGSFHHVRFMHSKIYPDDRRLKQCECGRPCLNQAQQHHKCRPAGTKKETKQAANKRRPTEKRRKQAGDDIDSDDSHSDMEAHHGRREHKVEPRMADLNELCNVKSQTQWGDLLVFCYDLRQAMTGQAPTVRHREIKKCAAMTKGLLSDLIFASTDRNAADGCQWLPAIRDDELQVQAAGVVAATMLQILPALQRLLSRHRGDEARHLKDLIHRLPLSNECKLFGYGRWMLTKIVVPAQIAGFIPKLELPSLDESRGKTGAPTQATLRATVRAGYLSKALSLARQATRQLAPVNRPTIRRIKEVTAEKFPKPDRPFADDDEVPWPRKVDGEIQWDDDEEVREQQKQAYGEESVNVKTEEVLRVMGGLKMDKAEGVGSLSNRFLRVLFGEDEAGVKRFVVPVFNLLLDGEVDSVVMDIMLTGRLVLLEKGINTDGSTAYRPLGVGCSLIRVLNKTVMNKLKDKCREHLQPNQLAVGVSDAGIILAALLQAIYNDGVSSMPTDVKNAYNTICRGNILPQLQQFCPAIVRWFRLCYEFPTQLWTTDGVNVGECSTGVIQGDPLSTLYYCMGFKPCIDKVQEVLHEAHYKAGVFKPDHVQSHVRVMCYADDLTATGDPQTLIESVENIADVYMNEAGAEMQTKKTILVIPHKAQDESRAEKAIEIAETKGIQVVRDGFIVMGIPVGSPEYVEQKLNELLKKYSDDLRHLHYFTRQQRHAIILYCINARPMFLQRALTPNRHKDSFEQFDKLLTGAVIRILGDDHENISSRYGDSIHKLRAIPHGGLGGLGMKAMSTQHERDFAYYSANRRLKTFLVETKDKLIDSIRRDRWAGESTHRTITPAEGYDPNAADGEQAPDDAEGPRRVQDPIETALQGHMMGDIPNDAVEEKTLPWEPNLDDATELAERLKLRTQAQLLAHTEALNALRADPRNNQLVAQVLSASVRGSGAWIFWTPIPGFTIKDEQFQQLMRMRLGVAPAPNLPARECHCRAARGPQLPPGQAGHVEQLDNEFPDPIHHNLEPLHGLVCRAPGVSERLRIRHNNIRDKLHTILNGTPGIVATKEARIRNSDAVADIALTKNGETFYVDLTVTCPATTTMVEHDSHKQQGVAARRAHRRKLQKYAPILQGGRPLHAEANAIPGFVPFVIETGGYVHRQSREWLDNLLSEEPQTLSRCYRSMLGELMRCQATMMAKYVGALIL